MQVAWLNDQQPLLSVFVADGAGSVSQGGEGAMLAVNEAMAYMSQKVQGGELGLNDVLATDIVLTIRQRLFAEAEAKELAVRDFACTFLGLISSANGTFYADWRWRRGGRFGSRFATAAHADGGGICQYDALHY